MLKKFIIQGIFLIVLIFLVLAFGTGKLNNLFPVAGPTQNAQLMLGTNKLSVEIADTPQKRSQGLGGRDSLASDSGMLFVFDKPDKYAFWMKGMKFAIDIIWIKDDKIADLIKNAVPPAAGVADNQLPLYMPNQPINKALEVSSGYIDAHNVKVGDEVKINP